MGRTEVNTAQRTRRCVKCGESPLTRSSCGERGRDHRRHGEWPQRSPEGSSEVCVAAKRLVGLRAAAATVAEGAKSSIVRPLGWIAGDGWAH